MKKLYEENKKLDLIFIEKYGENQGDIFIKNKLALLVEIGELANELKHFKYWSIRKPNYDLVLEEYVDVLMFVLTFMHNSDLELEVVSIDELGFDELFICLYKLAVDLEDNLIPLYSYVLYLGTKLGFTDTMIEEAFIKKINIAKERMENGY